jgi:flavin reductase (DIM6/NTAB) family NADH-FMN oxidoreductase RutF
VINLVDEPIAEAMNLCAIDFPPQISEIEVAGFDLVPSQKVAPPRIAQAPVSLECRRYVTLEAARERYLVVGEAVVAHVRDGLIDPATLRVDRDAYAPIGRLFGGGYVRTHDRFEMPRLTYRQWLDKTRGSGGQ